MSNFLNFHIHNLNRIGNYVTQILFVNSRTLMSSIKKIGQIRECV